MFLDLSKGNFNLVCVAHPDDETIFFGGLVQKKLANTPEHPSAADLNVPWVVICATFDGNDDRKRQFAEACKILGVRHHHTLGLMDRYDQRLSIEDMILELRKLPEPLSIYTHNIVGEYGHPHHQDVSYAVHSAFEGHPNLYSVAYNCFPEVEIHLSQEEYEIKTKILTEVYSSETKRFLNLIPSTFVEGYRRLDRPEVEAIYDYFARGKTLDLKKLKAHRGLAQYLPHLRDLPRPF